MQSFLNCFYKLVIVNNLLLHHQLEKLRYFKPYLTDLKDFKFSNASINCKFWSFMKSTNNIDDFEEI